MQDYKLSIIIPCYNEELIVNSTFESINNYMNEHLPTVTWEMIFVNDGSTDDTSNILKELETTYSNINTVNYHINQGRGNALSTGLSASKGEHVISLDADLSYDVNHIGEIYSALTDNNRVDVVVVSPYSAKGIVKNVPFKRLALSKIANWILSSFFDNKLSTVTCVVRGYKGDLVRSVFLQEKGKEIHLEILRKLSLLQSNIIEIPGRLIWKKSIKERRKTNLRVANAAKTHFLYGLMMKPSIFLKYATILLFLIGCYESMTILVMAVKHLTFSNGLFAGIWSALKTSYKISPHTYFIALGSLIISIQMFSFLLILITTKLQQEELLKHLLPLLKNNSTSRK